MTTGTSTRCPAWCTDHLRFEDGSDDWHKGREVELHGFEFFLTTGTTSGATENYFHNATAKSDSVSLDDAERVALAILELVKAARG